MPIWLTERLRVRPRDFANLFHSNIKKGKGKQWQATYISRIVATVNYKLEARLSVWVYISTYGRLLRGYKHLQYFEINFEGVGVLISCQHLKSRLAQGLRSICKPGRGRMLMKKSSPTKKVWNCGLHPLIHTIGSKDPGTEYGTCPWKGKV